MKTLSMICLLVLLSIPAWADDDLNPAPLDQAIAQYNGLVGTKDIDPMNHEVWKLYVFYDLTPHSGFDKTPKWFVTSLTPDKKYRVVISINQLYNFIQPRPKPGDVIVVEGHVTEHFNLTVDFNRGLISKRVTVPAVSMYVEGAVYLKEHFVPVKASAPPPSALVPLTPTPGGHR